MSEMDVKEIDVKEMDAKETRSPETDGSDAGTSLSRVGCDDAGAVDAEPYDPEHSWQRQPGESSKAFGKFSEYRDLGPDRSLSKLSRSHESEEGWSLRALEDLSQRWRWQLRASAWDEEQDRLRRRALARAAAEMAERQARDGADMQRLARGAMGKWVRKDPDTGQLVLATNLSPADVARLYRLGFEIERTARGEPTLVTEEHAAAVKIVEVELNENQEQEPVSS